ncbi:MAG: hypothetical protein LBV27_02410, partial [Oscillospiraceae bacterium]|nr:hypothetical protein [Oscillospiraceae bacterium]
VSGLTLLNKPDKYDITVTGDTINNVKFVGYESVLSQMTADDIVMECDLAEREITEGQYQLPVRFSVPTKGFVWATGEYSVILEVKERES